MNVTVVGGGMITHDQLLPPLYHLQRTGAVGEISICALRSSPLRALVESETLCRAFPGQTFRAYPDLATDPERDYPDLFREVIAKMPPRNLVVVAVPDQAHFDVIRTALAADQHVLTVKPLVLKAAQAAVIEREAAERRLLVGIEYHKRFDDRSLMARQAYREGRFGEFRLGTARLFEKWYYRHSNFQNWCTAENSDAFTYVGCHYVDLVAFITGLVPTAVSVYGIRDRYPNGREGYLWTDARVIWSNSACLNVQNGLGFPDAAPGSNTQGMTLYCSGNDEGGLIDHSDQYRGLKWCYPEERRFFEPSPDYLQYVDLGGPGLVPVGYGYRSVAAIVEAARAVEAAADKAAALKAIDEAGILATPSNSRYNELVIEAGRESILSQGREVKIQHTAEAQRAQRTP